MLKVHIKDGEQIIFCESTVRELLLELGLTIGALYSRIKLVQPQAAEKFRRALIQALTDPESPIWSQDVNPDAGFSICIPTKKKKES